MQEAVQTTHDQVAPVRAQFNLLLLIELLILQDGEAKANTIIIDSVIDVQNVEGTAGGQHARALELEKKLAQALHQVKMMEEANALREVEKVAARTLRSLMPALPRERSLVLRLVLVQPRRKHALQGQSGWGEALLKIT